MRSHRRSLTVIVAASCALWLLSTAGRTAPLSVVSSQTPAPAAQSFELPNREGSLKFFVIGDFGDGDREQYRAR